MRDANATPPWYAPWRASERAATPADPADLGTAFGLDMSMKPPAEAPRAADPTPQPGWMRRLAPRRSPRG